MSLVGLRRDSPGGLPAALAERIAIGACQILPLQLVDSAKDMHIELLMLHVLDAMGTPCMLLVDDLQASLLSWLFVGHRPTVHAYCGVALPLAFQHLRICHLLSWL